MKLFNFKKETQKASCCENVDEASIKAAQTSMSEGASIKVLGGGCAKCNQLEAAVKAALLQLGMQPDIDHVRDFAQIAAYGVMTTPALVVDGKVVSFGKVLTQEEAVAILQKARD